VRGRSADRRRGVRFGRSGAGLGDVGFGSRFRRRWFDSITIVAPNVFGSDPIVVPEPLAATLANGTGSVIKFNPAMRPSVDEMSAIFLQAWHKSTTSIFFVASICDYIERTYNAEERHDLIRRLPVDRTRLGRLARLGRDQRLPAIAHLLPASASTLCLLSEFTDGELAAARQAGVVRPGTTRKAVAAWLVRHRAAAAGHLAAAELVTYAVIRLPANPPQEMVGRINNALGQLREFAEIEISYPQADAWLRPKLRQLIADTKAARLGGRPNHISQTEWRRRQWPFRAKDLAIGPTTSFSRMRAIADRIGQAQAFTAMLEQG
jgi:hypothetical protein